MYFIKYLKISVLLIVIVFLLACNKKGELIEQENIDYDVFVVIGQSNTYSGIFEEGFDENAEGYFFINNTDSAIFELGRFEEQDYKIIIAKEPLSHHFVHNNKIGFALTFANLFKHNFLQENRKILLVPSAKGGTGFYQNGWNKNDYLYNDALERVQHVLALNGNNKLVGILWHQGEADVENESYEADLDDFIKNFRCDIDNEQVPFLLGGMVPYWVGTSDKRNTVQNIIEDTPNRINLTAYVNPNLPFVIEKPDNNFDHIHYSADGLIELGKRYFFEFEKLVE